MKKAFAVIISLISINSTFAASMKIDLMEIVLSTNNAEAECEAKCNWMETEAKSRKPNFSIYSNVTCEARTTVGEGEGGPGIFIGKSCVLFGIKSF